MPLKSGKSNKTFQYNVKELIKDNNKSGKEKGANVKKRSMKQILAIAYAKKK